MSLNYRTLNLAGFLACAALIISALIMQHVFEMEPCPLCIFQRVAVLAAAAVFLVAAIHNPRGRVGAALYGGLSLAAVLGGIGVAWRHLWLQSLPPDQVPSCGPGLDYMMDILPMRDVVAMVLSGSGECAEIDFLLMGKVVLIKTMELPKHLMFNEHACPGCPEHFLDIIVLAFIFFNGLKNPASTKWIPQHVNKSTGGTGIFKMVLLF